MPIKGRNEVLKLDEAILYWLSHLSEQGILTTDAKLNVYSWNHWLEIHTKVAANQIIGTNLLTAFPEIVTRRLDRYYYQALQGQVVILSQRLHGYLIQMPPRGGNTDTSPMPQSIKIAPLISDGNIIGTLTVIEDVTERIEYETKQKKQIQELEKTQESLRKIATENLKLVRAVDSASDGVVITDPNLPDNPIIYINSAFSRITGYQIDEVINRNCRFLQGSGTDPDTVAQIRQSLLENREVTATLLNYRKDGEPFWNELKISPVFSEEGKLIYFVGIQRDVSDRYLAEQKITEQAALLDIATDAILVEDLDGQILFWNKGAERLYGYSAAEAIGKKANQFLDDEISPLVEVARQSVIQKGNWYGELNQITKGGTQIIVESRWTLVKDNADKPKSILIVNSNITQKKLLESQFLRAQRMESIGTLAGGIAHDLNNVLTPILGATQLLQSGLSPAHHQQWLSILETNARRGANLVKQVLSFARGFEGKRSLLQPSHLIWEIGDIAKETFPKSIEVYVNISPDLSMVYGDATQLHQVLMNLCVNARDSMPHGGTLNISAENTNIDNNYVQMNIDAQVGSYIVITVTDTGIGIPVEILDRIFEPFFTTKELGKGTGLGLSTVIGIIRSHSGFVKVESTPKKGTQFKVYLPAIEENEPPTLPIQEIRKGQGELILFVDDETAIQEITEATLKNYNYNTLIASDGIEAIALYAQHKNEISLVIIDMMMPLMDGATAIRTLKKINPQVKIIASSGLTSKDKIAEAASLGVKTFLSKPYTAEDLLKIINESIIGN